MSNGQPGLPTRHELRLAATAALWDRRSMSPEHSEEIVDDVLDAVLPLVCAADRIAELERERDEWEERYDDLLSRCGGTMP